MRAVRIAFGVTVCAMLFGCTGVPNVPINVPLGAERSRLASDGRPSEASQDDMLVGLAFSGGGTRAAAFSFGVLDGVSKVTFNERGRSVALIDRIDFVTAVSGGSVTAAYFGLKNRAALADFRARFLVRDAEEALNTSVDVPNLMKAMSGGVNQDVPFRNWLDANLFEGAKFSALLTDRRPRVWINATDIYNRTTFVFGKTAFSAICSDLAEYPVAAAVAASAAVPLAFAPVILETFPGKCRTQLPPWILKAADNPNASPLLRSYARGVRRYNDGSMRYVKLLDGGLIDNFGLSGFTIARESAEAPYEPMSRAEGVTLRRILFLVVDSGRGPQGDWAGKLDGPSGAELVTAVTDAALDANVRASYSAFEANMTAWRESLVRWRCGLSRAEVSGLLGKSSAGWNCRDIKLFIGRIGFDQFDPVRAARLEAVPTRFKLPVGEVDDLIAAGGEALSANATFRAFRQSL
ncbi:patatin-like phospholipase family protein [Xanthobacteraceae bacterium Astr-EGSB]|uniref:patatin-like phospholipase family protein n=1 Tax=Astrobacterium formosum TaxID=3069710 RepID=UPI0027AE13F7|nr:patatin-like phospholipase family protein [Xanthobacteraceae bacterium Astr-EGSB]